MSTHNIGFYEEISKIILNYHQISSNTQLISSSGLCSRDLLAGMAVDSRVKEVEKETKTPHSDQGTVNIHNKTFYIDK